jgi:hypothetical protein
LEAHIAMSTRASYKKRFKEHVSETKRYAREVKQRIKQLGGVAETVSAPGPPPLAEAAQAVLSGAQKAVALAQGPMRALRETSARPTSTSTRSSTTHEMNVVTCDPTVARETRLALWAEHLERPVEEVYGDPGPSHRRVVAPDRRRAARAPKARRTPNPSAAGAPRRLAPLDGAPWTPFTACSSG